MNTTTTRKHHPRDLFLAEVGLTADQLDASTRHTDDTQVNLVCTEDACHVATNEFELISITDRIKNKH